MNTQEKVRKLLIVEDNLIAQCALKEMLEHINGCSADFAEDGKTALALYNKEYDLVLMDIDLPDIDGITVTKIIRRIEKERNVPIIAMTSHHNELDYQQQCLSAGMNGYSGKPTKAQLEQLINEYASDT